MQAVRHAVRQGAVVRDGPADVRLQHPGAPARVAPQEEEGLLRLELLDDRPQLRDDVQNLEVPLLRDDDELLCFFY